MKNGLYTLHIEMLDGVAGRNGGVMVLHDGTIRGGDSYFYYTGSYSFADGRWKGELISNEHTPTTAGKYPVFGGREVGIGFSGTYSDEGAEALATALSGKRSIRFRAVMRKLVEA
ncbi:GrlR family regulatory protein [Bradyrhizobium sp. LHD-71]|uniref:GrlR family regulatory protein n=1 Tax=Bradyrhizobium sp. LHD-71 TaxID=3072141 RepID=UPI00280E218A|nr:GrlR family regulatory protein [Bradyrhizobium sp. LHD-71]MDQ8729924.1 GrlR family regulatory protein [Bradyrhizobium sp. LHD-71]